MYQELITTTPVSELMQKLLKEKNIARSFVERRHEEWNDNYELYRNKVKTNRLTQRQSVNVPLMKETIKTLLSKIDDPPMVEWRELGGDKDKEIIFQEIWNDDFNRMNLEGVDLQDKKTVMLFGRGFKKLNWLDNKIDIRALDIFDVVIDPLVNPLDLETARFVIHQNIFRSLREILADERYNQEAKDKLKIWVTTKEGIVQTAQNKEEWEKKMKRLKDMGVDSVDFPLFAGGDILVNLTEHYTKIWDTKDNEFEMRVVVYADDVVELLNESLTDLLGIDFYPFVTWGEDMETQDFWSDGPADLVRVPNKILNVWFSQLVENRTLRNFQMHWYDATIPSYVPQTYEPGPGRMLPAPGDPNKTIMPVEIQGLDETLTAIDFITKLIERGTSATAIEKGVTERKQITLGEVQTLVGKAMERTIAMAKFYRRSWEELARKYYVIMDANASKKVTLYKTGRSGKLWPMVVYPGDWRSVAGFKSVVRSTSEQEDEKTKGIQRFLFLLTQFPDNTALRRIAQKRMLEIVDLTPEEMREVEDTEKQKLEMAQQQTQSQGQQPQPAQPQQPSPASPQEEAMMKSLEQQIAQFSAAQ